MPNRREFLKSTAAAVSVLAIGSISQAVAAGPAPYANIIYTKSNPGRWAGKEGSHAPQVTVNGSKVTVVTNHPMSMEHFIVKHTLVLEDGTFVGDATFTPDVKPESSYELPADYKGKFSVTSFCNIHDFWMTDVTV